METDDTPMHVGVLAIFTPPRNAAGDYVAGIARKLRAATDVVAPWNSQLVRGVTAGLGGYALEETDCDLEYHFRHSALPAPGGERELGVMVSRLHSHALDRSRPLWEFHLIEGLERDRFAFYLKLHHALVDNINAVPLLLQGLSAGARSKGTAAPWTRPLRAAASRPEAWWEDLADPWQAAGSLGRAAGGMLRGALRPRAASSVLMPRGTPRSTLNRQINSQRRFATWQLSQARIEAVAAATDSTVNEILTYLCGSSLRRFFKEYNALPDDSLVAVIPVTLQERSERLPGNAIAGLRVSLGTHIGNPMARLQAVKKSIHAVREDRASLPSEAVTSYVLMRAAPLYASQLRGVGRFVPPLFNLAVSNTPGSARPLYFNGARLEAVYPMSPLLQFTALSIDCVSYADTLNVGFTGALDTLPHLQRLAVYLGRALDDLEELVAAGEVSA
jgi:WS/DGAT/MGAT family acyltransferase